jgi:hypothetical protein
MTGQLRWAFDTREALRSSPAIDGEGHVYLGSGQGRLFVLNPDGTLRWSLQLIDDTRNDLNSSPALGKDAIYLAGESGQVFSVPYDYCLRPEQQSNTKCTTTSKEDLPDEGAFLLPNTNLGAMVDALPDIIDPNQALTFSLLVRKGGNSELAIIDSTNFKVTTTPQTDVNIDISGDGRFVTLTPKTQFPIGSDLNISISGQYLTNMERTGLRLSGGTVGGTIQSSFKTKVQASSAQPFPLPVSKDLSSPTGVWELSRLALPLPTILPSYNQIGFDSLHFLVSIVELEGSKGVAWLSGARLAADENRTELDPTSKAIFPLAIRYQEGFVTLENQDGLRVEIMNATIPFKTFRIGAAVDPTGAAKTTATVSGNTICKDIPTYGSFLQVLGLCNPQTDVLSVFGGLEMKPFAVANSPGAALGTVVVAGGATEVSATFQNSQLKPGEHSFGLLLVDADLGTPVSLDYGLDTKVETDSTGHIGKLSVPFKTKVIPKNVRVYVMVDLYPSAMQTVTLP